MSKLSDMEGKISASRFIEKIKSHQWPHISRCYVPSSILNPLCVLIHFILEATEWKQSHHHPYSTGEEADGVSSECSRNWGHITKKHVLNIYTFKAHAQRDNFCTAHWDKLERTIYMGLSICSFPEKILKYLQYITLIRTMKYTVIEIILNMNLYKTSK